MAVNRSSLLSGLSSCLHPHMAGVSETPLLWCGGCMQCLMGTFWGLAGGAGLGTALPLTLHCSLFRWPQSGFSASLTICCMFYTQIKSLDLEPAFLPCLLPFLSSSSPSTQVQPKHLVQSVPLLCPGALICSPEQSLWPKRAQRVPILTSNSFLILTLLFHRIWVIFCCPKQE